MKLSQPQINHIASINPRATIAQAQAEGRVMRAEVLDWRAAYLELAAEKALAGLWRESRDAAEKGRTK